MEIFRDTTVHYHKFDNIDATPENPTSGVFYYVLSESMALSGGDMGNLLIYPNVEKRFEEKKYLYPIPEDERLLNPALGQNPGWEL